MKVLVFDSDETVRTVFSGKLVGHDVAYNDGVVTDEVLAQHTDTEILSVFVSSEVAARRIDMLPKLKCIVARSTGVDHIDAAYAKSKGIVLTNVPRYGQVSVAEFTFALILSLSRNVFNAADQIREKGNFSIRNLQGFDLCGKTLGVIGTGAIGSAVIKIAKGFGMHVLMHDVHQKQELVDEYASYAPLDEVYATADVITLHVPYLPENHHMLNAEAFAKMKRGSIVVNTARGELIDTSALIDAIKSGQVGGVGIDVMEEERALKQELAVAQANSAQSFRTLVQDHVLVNMPNVIVTPHIAFFTHEAYDEILSTSIKNILSFAEGKPVNVVT